MWKIIQQLLNAVRRMFGSSRVDQAVAKSLCAKYRVAVASGSDDQVNEATSEIAAYLRSIEAQATDLTQFMRPWQSGYQTPTDGVWLLISPEIYANQYTIFRLGGFQIVMRHGEIFSVAMFEVQSDAGAEGDVRCVAWDGTEIQRFRVNGEVMELGDQDDLYRYRRLGPIGFSVS